jgi:hypothetical protein
LRCERLQQRAHVQHELALQIAHRLCPHDIVRTGVVEIL